MLSVGGCGRDCCVLIVNSVGVGTLLFFVYYVWCLLYWFCLVLALLVLFGCLLAVLAMPLLLVIVLL